MPASLLFRVLRVQDQNTTKKRGETTEVLPANRTRGIGLQGRFLFRLKCRFDEVQRLVL